MSDTSQLSAELARLRSSGLTLPRNPYRALESYSKTAATAREMNAASGRDLAGLSSRLGRPITSANYDSPEVQEIMRHNTAMSNAMGQGRRLAARQQRLSSTSSSVGPDIYNAIPRFYDPLEYWDLSGLPWNVQDEGHRHKLHKWLRLYYATHNLVGILVDIFTRFPLIGMELECKDPQIQAFYESLFFDQLGYADFLVSLGREFWVVGEAFPLGSFDSSLGVWEHEELINPEDIVIENFPMLNSSQMKIVPPDYLKRIAQTKQPAREWRMLQTNFEDLIPYLRKGEHIPISPVLLKQIGNKLNDWDDHGTPILLRGLRTLLHEEKLLASQDAIAERLYSPLILAKLGIQDMGDGLPPFIPGPEELESVRDDFDMALSSDFRLMVHHFGLEVSNVFGREQMPRLGDDFDRIERKLMQLFGVNPSLLSAGAGSQPYASSALQAEFLNQILKTFQDTLKNHFRERAMVVAEAQQHFDYEVRGTTRIPIYETVVEFDADGNKTLKEVPKLLVPDLKFATLDLRDEATERQFLQSLRSLGVPIPDQDLMVGVSWKIKDKIDKYNSELKEKTISQQQAKYDTYMALTAKGLPVPGDLRAEVESVLMPNQQAPMGGDQSQLPGGPPMGAGGGGGGPSAPAPGAGIVMPGPPADLGGGPGTVAPGGGPPPTSGIPGQPRGNVPEISNERRPGLTYNPTASVRQRVSHVLSDFMAEHGDEHLGVPFVDYVATESDTNWLSEAPKISDEEVQDLYDKWPDKQALYTAKVHWEVVEHLANLRETLDSDTLGENNASDELRLAAFQRLETDGEGQERIVEHKANKRVIPPVPPEKKYSIVDPEAEPLADDEEELSEPTD